METIYEMITVEAARAMNIPRFEVKTGSPAHLVVLDAASVHEAPWHHEAPLCMISHGHLVDSKGLPGARGRSR